MGRNGRKKETALTAITPDMLREATEELATAVLGRSPLARVVARLAGAAVFTKAGGNVRRRTSNPTPTHYGVHGKVVTLPGGIEYIPPPQRKG